MKPLTTIIAGILLLSCTGCRGGNVYTPAITAVQQSIANTSSTFNKGSLEILLEHLMRLKSGGNINDKDMRGMTALMAAAHSGHTETARLLIDSGADVQCKGMNGWTALAMAAQQGCSETVKLLLEKGANPNIMDNNGATALMNAVNGSYAKGDYPTTVKLLIEKGVDVNAKDNNGGTALMVAKIFAKPEIVELLKANGAKEQTSPNTMSFEFFAPQSSK